MLGVGGMTDYVTWALATAAVAARKRAEYIILFISKDEVSGNGLFW